MLPDLTKVPSPTSYVNSEGQKVMDWGKKVPAPPAMLDDAVQKRVEARSRSSAQRLDDEKQAKNRQ